MEDLILDLMATIKRHLETNKAQIKSLKKIQQQMEELNNLINRPISPTECNPAELQLFLTDLTDEAQVELVNQLEEQGILYEDINQTKPLAKLTILQPFSEN